MHPSYRAFVQRRGLYNHSTQTEGGESSLEKRYSDITPYIHELADMSNSNHLIEPAMYEKHHVQRGLRDINGNGVVAG